MENAERGESSEVEGSSVVSTYMSEKRVFDCNLILGEVIEEASTFGGALRALQFGIMPNLGRSYWLVNLELLRCSTEERSMIGVETLCRS